MIKHLGAFCASILLVGAAWVGAQWFADISGASNDALANGLLVFTAVMVVAGCSGIGYGYLLGWSALWVWTAVGVVLALAEAGQVAYGSSGFSAATFFSELGSTGPLIWALLAIPGACGVALGVAVRNGKAPSPRPPAGPVSPNPA